MRLVTYRLYVVVVLDVTYWSAIFSLFFLLVREVAVGDGGSD